VSQKNEFNRRTFLKTSVAGAFGTGVLRGKLGEEKSQETKQDKVKIKEYRTLGRTGFKVSDISFGAGYLNDPGVLNAALDMGINYIDTAEHYEQGRSERTIGEVLPKRDRKSIFLTTKLNLNPRMGNNTYEGLKERFHKCLERLKTDYVDCFMIHMTASVKEVSYEPYHKLVKELKAEGKVKFTGLSNHGLEFRLAGTWVEDPMEQIIGAAAEDGRFDVALFVYNFIQKEQGEKIIKTCKKHNIGITLMKTDPVKFHMETKGMFERIKNSGREIPEVYAKLYQEYETFIKQADAFKEQYKLTTPAQIRDAAIKFVLSNPGVHAACPSITTYDELNSFAALSGKKLEDSDTSMLLDYKDTLGRFYCRHACGICEQACPHHVPVNTIMRYNHYFEAHGREKHAMMNYAKLAESNADKCRNCEGFCESRCPYNVPVQTLLISAHQNLTLV